MTTKSLILQIYSGVQFQSRSTIAIRAWESAVRMAEVVLLTPVLTKATDVFVCREHGAHFATKVRTHCIAVSAIFVSSNTRSSSRAK